MAPPLFENHMCLKCLAGKFRLTIVSVLQIPWIRIRSSSPESLISTLPPPRRHHLLVACSVCVCCIVQLGWLWSLVLGRSLIVASWLLLVVDGWRLRRTILLKHKWRCTLLETRMVDLPKNICFVMCSMIFTHRHNIRYYGTHETVNKTPTKLPQNFNTNPAKLQQRFNNTSTI